VDPVLARLAGHPDDNLRRAAVEAIGFRLRKRNGLAGPLTAALAHRDPQTQFLAAEALARAGRGEGLSVLLAAVDSLPHVPLRQRAVRALGELGDPRALNTLLRLATEDAHVLQQEAAEAIGHLGHSAEGPEIFKLLARLATRGTAAIAGNALRGLRWLGTRDAWQVIRKALADAAHSWREVAAEMLGHDDDPATRDLLLKTAATDADLGVATAAFVAARQLPGADALEPHYAWLQNPHAEYHEDGESLELMAKAGDPKRIFDILPRCSPAVQDALANVLLGRPALPLSEAAAAVASPDAKTAQVAARVLGRAGEAAPPQSRDAIATALVKWLRAWEELRSKLSTDYDDQERLTGTLTPTVRAFAWAAGRVDVADDVLVAAIGRRPSDPLYRPIRRDAVRALDKSGLSTQAQSALEVVATGDDADARPLATDILARHAPARAARLAEAILTDRTSFERLARHLPAHAAVTGALRTGLANPHYQGVAIVQLVSRAEVDSLAAVAKDRAVAEVSRFGAVDALGKLGNTAAEAHLVAIGTSDGEPVELRKAAWRALRRSKRTRAASAQHPGTEAKA
jgi:ParB family chromosome partitioning protein